MKETFEANDKIDEIADRSLEETRGLISYIRMMGLSQENVRQVRERLIRRAEKSENNDPAWYAMTISALSGLL